MDPQELVYSSSNARAVLLTPHWVVAVGVGVMVQVLVQDGVGVFVDV